jgi:hypothetical protein
VAVTTTPLVLLALPRGGFNDMLCQLEICARAAEATGRTLVVDTRQSGLEDDLFACFDPAPGQRMVRVADWAGTVTVRAGRVEVAQGGSTTVWQVPGDDPSLRHGQDQAADAPILLHYSAGGGELGIRFLHRLRLKPALAQRILAARRAVGGRYAAVHIRHTDYRTDFAGAFGLIARRMRGWRLLICSDSEAPIVHFAETHGDAFDWTTSDAVRSSDHRSLHYSGGERVAERNAEMLTDLYLMATAERLVMVDTLNSKRSGFAVLAAHMRRRLDVAALDRGTDGAGALELKARFPLWLRSLSGNPFRVWRLRKLGDRPGGRLVLHPTPE